MTNKTILLFIDFFRGRVRLFVVCIAEISGKAKSIKHYSRKKVIDWSPNKWSNAQFIHVQSSDTDSLIWLEQGNPTFASHFELFSFISHFQQIFDGIRQLFLSFDLYFVLFGAIWIHLVLFCFIRCCLAVISFISKYLKHFKIN